MKRSDHGRAFFYAEAEAGVYDVSIEAVVPHYREQHDTLFQLLTNHVREHWSADTRRYAGAVLDLGSGTGAESLRVLDAFPRAHVVAVDFCAPMHAILRRAVRSKGFGDRCTFVTGDIVGPACSPARLRRKLPEAYQAIGYDAVISAFTIHHLDHEQKAATMRRVYELLRPGGIFLNADLFSFQSRRLAQQALAFDLAWMENHFGPRANTSSLPSGVQRRLLRQWRTHYRKYNRVEPIENPPANSRAQKGQAQQLLDAGFATVAVPYRFWQTGILLAIK